MVTFTGSDVVGARVMAQAAPTIKRVLLELGGKSALIVRADADAEAALSFAAQNIITQAGRAAGSTPATSSTIRCSKPTWTDSPAASRLSPSATRGPTRPYRWAR